MNVSTDEDISFVSSAGYALGYLGGGLLIILNAWAVQSPSTFGLSSAAEAVQWSFLSVALWWTLFSIPMYLYVPEKAQAARKISFAQVSKEVWRTLKKCSPTSRSFFFLIAYIFYIDGINTIIKMAVDFALSIS